MKTPRWPLALGALLTALAIGLAALASHALPEIMLDPTRSQRFTTGLQMHAINAPGLVLFGIALMLCPANRLWLGAAALLLLGIVFFSGNLYLLAFLQNSPAPWLTPVGGLCLMSSWLIFAVGAFYRPRVG